MAVSNELNTLKANISNAYNAIQAKGGTIPTNKNTQNLSEAINTIQGGGGGTDYFVDSIVVGRYKATELIKTIPPITVDSNLTEISAMFSGCKSLETVPLFDTSHVTHMQDMFNRCRLLKTVPLFDTSRVTQINGMFSNCAALITIPSFDTSSATNMAYMFNNCTSLAALPLLNTSKVLSLTSMLYSCNKLENIGGFQNLGNAYLTTRPANYGSYELNLSSSKKLTHDSLMNVINNLYDIATKGCKAQKLILGTDNKAKLTAEEIAIATNKGWTVS